MSRGSVHCFPRVLFLLPRSQCAHFDVPEIDKLEQVSSRLLGTSFVSGQDSGMGWGVLLGHDCDLIVETLLPEPSPSSVKN